MIRFLTLFLGLVHGTQTVELETRPDVASVELRLDGAQVGTLDAPPWRCEVALGDALLPHRLEALARDAAGGELATAELWLNHDRPAASDRTAAVVALAPGVELPAPAAMIGWFTAAGAPLEVLATETGPAEVVMVRDPYAQEAFDELARFFFEDALRAPLADDLWDPAVLERDRDGFIAWATVAWGELLDQLKRNQLAGLAPPAHLPGSAGGTWAPAKAERMFGALWDAWRADHALGDGVTLRFLSPAAAPVSRIERPLEIFNVSRPTWNRGDRSGRGELGLLWLLVENRPLEFRLRFADAAAVAALETRGRRRAVVLLLSGEVEDKSLYTARRTRDYLRARQVPLVVWTIAEGPAGDPAAALVEDPRWGLVRRIHPGSEPVVLGQGRARYRAAIDELETELRGQRVVWLAGRHLPQTIALGPAAVDAGVRLAGTPVPGVEDSP